MSLATVLVAVPVLGRPERARPLADSLREVTESYRLLFLVSPSDEAQRAACERTGEDFLVVPWEPGRGDFARKINYAVKHSKEPWILMGADDLCFCPGWAEHALMCGDTTGAGVIGTQDWGNSRVMQGQHSTHPLVRRSYIKEQGTIDKKGLMLHEGYDHNFVDDELVGTAKHRGEWTFCPDSEIPHLHPDWGKGEWDATYVKGRAGFNQDAALFHARSKLWT